MPEPIVISIDAMGGDRGPPVVVPGIALGAEQWRARNVRFLLHGDKARIEAEFAQHPAARDLCEIRHTDQVISGDEKPAQAMRRGKGSSLWNAVEAVRDGQAQAAVSSGNTGALMAVSKLLLRMIVPDLERPAIVVSWPNPRGYTTILDMGANIDCDAERLVDFAIMGEAFHRAVHGAARPSVGLLNVGTEDQKGKEDVREAHRLLSEGGLNLDYRGFVEGSDISKGTVDVIVTDGFTGNVALKTAEGVARFISAELRAALTSSLITKIGAFIAQGALRKLRDRIDPPDGGPLLGLNGIVVKSHGGTDPKGFANAIRVAVDLAQSEFASEIRRNLEQLTAALNVEASTGGASAEPNG
ncbi:MAG: phosphate acyltransferase PlsX [Caulobacteraceae bacterium]|nr:phosphate acyltransferase PlsX [Caulobacteraceae bacterium]